MMQLDEAQRGILATIRDFVKREVIPTAMRLDEPDEYPFELVERMKELGLFGATIPQEYGGLGLNTVTYALIFEEICRGWMSVSGILGSNSVMTTAVATFGTREQRTRLLPAMARGERRGGIGLTEPDYGSDLANVQTRAVRKGNHYVINGTKTLITNGEHGNTFALLVRTDPEAKPAHRGLSLFIVEKGKGFTASRHIPKLGYRGVDTAELVFQDYVVPAEDLIGGEEGHGFRHIMSGLEVGRINVAARAVGVARAALEAAVQYSQKRRTFGVPIAEHQAIQLYLADMATQVQAAHLLVLHAAQRKDAGQRCDLEAGMAKLFASEICLQVATNAMRIHGGYGYTKDLPLERYFRDAPLMIIGEGTNEIQRLVIARNLLRNFPTGDIIGEGL